MVPRPLRDLGVESDTLGQGMFRGEGGQQEEGKKYFGKFNQKIEAKYPFFAGFSSLFS